MDIAKGKERKVKLNENGLLCTYLHEHLVSIIFDIIFGNVLQTKTEINENNAHGREHKTKENVQDDRFQ